MIIIIMCISLKKLIDVYYTYSKAAWVWVLFRVRCLSASAGEWGKGGQKDFMAVRNDSGSEMKGFANIAQNIPEPRQDSDKLLEQHVPQSESVLYLVLAFFESP